MIRLSCLCIGLVSAVPQRPTSAGNVLRLPVTRDTWVSTAPDEALGNNGGSPRLKLKSCQELSLVDLDPTLLAGRVVDAAELHVRSVSVDRLRRVTVSSVASEWIEGTSTDYTREVGAASFRWSETGRRAWTDDGGDLARVILGAGNTTWGFAEASSPDERGWQTIAVDPRVIRARVAGISHGFALFDDVGSEYTRDGDVFVYHPFPNRFLASRESGADSAPYWTIHWGAEDRSPPQRIEGLALATRTTDGRPVLTWKATEDEGAAGVAGYFVRFSTENEFDWELARNVPQSRVPTSSISRILLETEIDRLGVDAETPVTFAARAVDGAGNAGPIATIRGAFPKRVLAPPLAVRVADARSVTPTPAPTLPPALMVTQRDPITVLDGLDKIELTKPIEITSAAESGEDVLWSPSTRQVRLSAAQNEFTEFQIVLERPFDGVDVKIVFDDPAIQTEWFASRGVATRNGRFGDPLVPITDTRTLVQAATPAQEDRYVCLWADVFVARTAQPGEHRGRVVVTRRTVEASGANASTAERQRVSEFAIALHVFAFALPDPLSFLPEMNAYDLPAPPEEIAWYRLAHEHRTVLNRLAYDWKGRVRAGSAPDGKVGEFDWKSYDARFGPLFDGSAFARSKRGSVPIETFYLPINENWPVPIEPHFRGGYWADEALDADYWAQFSHACGEIAEHFAKRGWNDTLFEFLLNDKVYFKDKSWSRSSAPWIFDEPTHTQDFFALRTFATAFHSGVFAKRGAAKFVFRADISRPEWQRDMLDGCLDVNVVGSAFSTYRPLVIDRQRNNGEIVLRYSTANRVDESNVMPAAWCIETWCLGGDGVIPWQTIGTTKSWTEGDALALLYPGEPAGLALPVASARLKAFRRGQQDTEYLIAWTNALGIPRAATGERVLSALGLGEFGGVASRSSADDAGELRYPRIDGRKLAALRRAVARQIEALAPQPSDRPFGFRTPKRDPSRLPQIAPLR